MSTPTTQAEAAPTPSRGALRAAFAYLPDCHAMAGESLRNVLTEERAELAAIIDRETNAGELAKSLHNLLSSVTCQAYAWGLRDDPETYVKEPRVIAAAKQARAVLAAYNAS